MNNKTPLQHLPLLIPLIAGALTCTGCIPPHMETPTATGDKKISKQATPDKMHTLLEQSEIATPDAEVNSKATTATTTPTVDHDAACFALPDCPEDKPDQASLQAEEFEQQFQQQPIKHKSSRKQHSSKHTRQPAVIHSRKEEEKPEQETPPLSALSTPENNNRLLAFVDLGTTLFVQTDLEDSLQTVNSTLTKTATDGLMFVQQFSAPHTLEMLQDGTSHAIQALNYVGADFTT